MNSQHHKGNSRYSSSILKLDTAYVESICLSYFGDNIVTKTDKILQSYYPKPEFTCPLCGAGDKKRGHRPAALLPTERGYFFKCLRCMQLEGAISFYKFLLKINPEIARNYQYDRWIKKLSGKDFNCPEPPKNIKMEHYQRLAREQYEQNKSEYVRTHKEQGA